MGKSKKRKASEQVLTGVAKAEVDDVVPIPNKEPIPTVFPRNGRVSSHFSWIIYVRS